MLHLYNSGQSNLKTSYFCALNAVFKKIVTYTKRVIVSHMSSIMNLWPNKYKAKCGALWTHYQTSIILNAWYFIHCQVKRRKFFCELLWIIQLNSDFFSTSNCDTVLPRYSESLGTGVSSHYKEVSL
jgi:hypothetical protein